MTDQRKPLGGKAYGSIPHLIGSRRGPGDKGVNPGQQRICCERTRDKYDRIVVQEKLDGSCCSVARIGDAVFALTRAGWLASSSPYAQHHRFAVWVDQHRDRFRAFLRDGERIVGEWLAQAHGTRYDLPHEPFVVFDLIGAEHSRLTYEALMMRLGDDFVTPRVIHQGGAFGIEAAQQAIRHSGHGALDPVEGAVWRAERKGAVDFLAKFVLPGKVDGCYLPEVTGGETVWNSWVDSAVWQPADGAEVPA